MEVGVSAIDRRPVKMILWSITFVQGGAQEFKVPGGEGRRGGGWRLRGDLRGLLPGQGSAAFLGADHRRGRGHGSPRFSPRTASGSTALRGAEPRNSPRLSRAQSGVGLDEEAHEVHWKLGHHFYESLELPDTRNRVLASVNEGFFCVFHVKVDPDLEVVSPSALGNLDISNTSPLYQTVSQHCVSLRRFGRISRFST